MICAWQLYRVHYVHRMGQMVVGLKAVLMLVKYLTCVDIDWQLR